MSDTTAPLDRRRPRHILSLILVGVIGGVLSGAFGVGGGIVMVPLFMWLTGLDQRRASATSLVAIVPTAIAGSISYLVNGEVDVLAALIIAAGGIGGSFIGTRLLKSLPLGWLRWLFIALMVLVAVRLFFEVPGRDGELVLSVGTVFALLAVGLVMGVASGLFGIGGGVVVVPALVAIFGISDLLAKGTSLLAMVPTALSGSFFNVRNGLVHPLDGIITGLAATAASFGGVAIAFLLPPRLSAVLFAILVLVAAAQLTVRAVRAQRAARGSRD
ncbi:MAG: sulfite exporter TauE/SafE family protein [Actinomycetales bacterium]|nr:sulfite exporter TauE/SafE family protein [Actinomycetales bacterium]